MSYESMWCIFVSIVLLLYEQGGKYMSVAEWVAIAIALFGVAGGIWRQVVQFKKDGQRIEGVNETSQSVKEDTSVMRPSVERMDKSVQEMREKYIARENRIDSTMENISELLEAKRIEEALKQRISQSIENPSYIEGAVKAVYEKNASLQIRVNELTDINVILEQENAVLKQQNQELKNEVKKLRMERQPEQGGRTSR